MQKYLIYSYIDLINLMLCIIIVIGLIIEFLIKPETGTNQKK